MACIRHFVFKSADGSENSVAPDVMAGQPVTTSTYSIFSNVTVAALRELENRGDLVAVRVEEIFNNFGECNCGLIPRNE